MELAPDTPRPLLQVRGQFFSPSFSLGVSSLPSREATPVVRRKGEMVGKESGGEDVGSVEDPGTH